MCGPLDYSSLYLVGERFLVLAAAAVMGLATYKVMNSVSTKDIDKLKRSSKRLFSYLRFK